MRAPRQRFALVFVTAALACGPAVDEPPEVPDDAMVEVSGEVLTGPACSGTVLCAGGPAVGQCFGATSERAAKFEAYQFIDVAASTPVNFVRVVGRRFFERTDGDLRVELRELANGVVDVNSGTVVASATVAGRAISRANSTITLHFPAAVTLHPKVGTTSRYVLVFLVTDGSSLSIGIACARDPAALPGVSGGGRRRQNVSGSYVDSAWRPSPRDLAVAVGNDLAAADCSEVLASGGSSGWYMLDPDGAGGPIPPFSTYCEMDLASGGWTLVDLRHASTSSVPTLDGLTATTAFPAALSDAAWVALRDRSTKVMLTTEDGSTLGAILDVAGLKGANCTALADSLANDELAHRENAGCQVSNADYCLFGYSPGRRTAIYNWCSPSFFDTFPLATRQNEPVGTPPFWWEPDRMRVYVR